MRHPRSTLAAVVRAFGEPISLEEVPVPAELEPGALLVEITASSMCGTDLHLWEGSLALPVDLPAILGHEMVGSVVAIGPGAELDSFGRRLRRGDRVLWSHAFCGHCPMCTRKQPALCPNRRVYGYESIEKPPHILGGFAQHAYVLPGSGRIRVPDEIPDALASMASCALRSVVNAVRQGGPVEAGQTVVVQGCGTLGVLATGLYKMGGAGRVITIGAPQSRLSLARDFGADQVISIEAMADPAERLRLVHEATDGLGADLVAEFSGHPAAFGEGLELLRPGGRYVVAGQLGGTSTPVAPGLITKKNLTVQGSFSGDIEHYEAAVAFLRRHRSELPFEKLVASSYPLPEINTALARMRSQQEIKPVLYPAAA